jgi:1,2-diacylglycerol 3-alpha-glucosyltransferase
MVRVAQEGRRLNEPLRIAYFNDGMSASGVDTSTLLVARALREQGCHVTIFVPWSEAFATADDVDVYRLPAMRVEKPQTMYWGTPLSLSVIAKFRRDGYDAVHVHNKATVALLAWQVARLFRLPLVYTFHTMTQEYVHYAGHIRGPVAPLVETAIELYDRLVCNAADVVVAPSQKAADYLAALEIAPEIRLIPNGVDRTRFRVQPNCYLRDRCHLPDDVRILLFVGRLNLEKRPETAYEIFRTLAARRDDAHLVMIGDGPLGETLAESSRADGLADRVHLLGKVDYAEMPLVYNSADIWISTSVSEVHPMVALEAAACGLPAVAIADRALVGVVEPGYNGFVAQCEDEFVGALDRVLSDAGLRAEMSQAASQIARRYDVAATAQRLAELYRDPPERRHHAHHPG